MSRAYAALPLLRLAELDLTWRLRLNRASQRRELEWLLAVISQLGDGLFWYALMLARLALQLF